jgi:hypothetical protein
MMGPGVVVASWVETIIREESRAAGCCGNDPRISDFHVGSMISRFVIKRL